MTYTSWPLVTLFLLSGLACSTPKPQSMTMSEALQHARQRVADADRYYTHTGHRGDTSWIRMNEVLQKALDPNTPKPTEWPLHASVSVDFLEIDGTGYWASTLSSVSMEKRADGWHYKEVRFDLAGNPIPVASGGGKNAPRACLSCHSKGHDFLFVDRPVFEDDGIYWPF